MLEMELDGEEATYSINLIGNTGLWEDYAEMKCDTYHGFNNTAMTLLRPLFIDSIDKIEILIP